MDYQLHDKGVNNLVFAIVMSAVKDYFSNNEEIKQDAISFLNSDMFIILTNGKIDSDVLMDKLQKSKRSDYFTPGNRFAIHYQ